MRVAACLVVVLALGSTARGEQRYEVWEEAGWIWGRDTQISEEWILSRHATGSQPVVDGKTTIWIDSRFGGTDIYGYSFTAAEIYGRNDAEFPILIDIPDQSDPRVSYMDDFPETYWFAWRQDGGVWGVYWALESTRRPFEVLPDYTGPFSLDMDVLTYDDGTIKLEQPEPPIPEPSTLALLACAVVGLLLRRKRSD